MSEMSFALNQKLRETFKDTLDDCFNLERLLMISSQLPFVPLFFFLSEDTSERQRGLRCALQLELCQLLIWVLKTISKSLQHPLSDCCPGFQGFWRETQSQGQFSFPLMTKDEKKKRLPLSHNFFAANKPTYCLMNLKWNYTNNADILKAYNSRNIFTKPPLSFFLHSFLFFELLTPQHTHTQRYQ